jgi:serine phosphatase RsbU (regulator of sigma subunit)/Tfp pilus assembly protein PilF
MKRTAKKYFLLSGILLLPLFAFTQIDTIDKKLDALKDDTSKVIELLHVSYRFQGNNRPASFHYGELALKMAENLGYLKGEGRAHNNLGDLYWYTGDYASSSDHYFKALKIYEGMKDRQSIALCYRNIGWVYYKQDDTENALKYYTLSMNINKELGLKERLGQNYNDIGIIYAAKKKFTDALAMYALSLKIQQETSNTYGMIANYGNMGLIYDEMGELDQAEKYLTSALELAEKENNKDYLSLGYLNLGNLYSKTNRMEKAEKLMLQGMQTARDINYKEGILDAYLSLADFYSKKNDFKSAFDYKTKAYVIKDSIYNEQNSRQVNEMTAQYESEKKELLISAQAEKLAHEKNFRLYLIAFCVLIAAFAFVLLRGNVQKKKANEKLSQAYHEIELKNKDITDSINYSKRIQDAILPAKEVKYKLFPHAFVLFKPKDIVSGDFYWFAEKDGKRLIAAADCTGHGVPGALMSMVGNNILNQVVIEKGITQPAHILDQLNAEVIKSLKQSGAENKDGMDIAMLVFHSEMNIEYAGAQRPLWIVRGKELIEVRPDKFSIGGLQLTQSHFTMHSIALQKNDCVYIFSDGYPDQFGGPGGKKFRSRQFKELLLSIHDLPMNEQEKKLDEAIENWKGQTMQVDDILVIGIRVGVNPERSV